MSASKVVDSLGFKLQDELSLDVTSWICFIYVRRSSSFLAMCMQLSSSVMQLVGRLVPQN
jgi:hypothetical protein